MSSNPASSNVEFQPSRHCRFCKKNVTCSGAKVPRVSLFNVVGNKQLVVYTGTESLILADVVASLGHKLVKDERLSSVSCLTCARTLTRIHGTFVKLVSQSNDGIQITSNSKRLSSSPTGISPSAKRSRENAAANRTPARSRRSLDLRDVPSSSNISEKENLDPMDVAANRTPQSRRSLDPMDVANSLADRMESEMNLSNADSQDSIMKVRLDIFS